ncbi:putative acylesterase/phospholipase RssA [Oxalobacteraceae bacterium GrIS 2.11]
MAETKKYQRCMVMAGGGFHFGYYLGIYAALCEANQPPDVLLASCGGAIAAALIQSLPDDAERRAWLSAPQMYHFWRGLKSTHRAKMSHAFASAMKRRILGHSAKYIPDLFHDYMFEIPAQLPLPHASANYIDVAIVAGKLNYAESEAGQLRGERKLFSEVVFCNQRTADLLESLPSPFSDTMYGDTAISDKLLTDTSMSVADAVRASISDMFYFRCHSHGTGDYIGGVIDLFPIEIADRIAASVTMELKGGYDDTYGIPAIQTVLGFNGNQRLQQVLRQHADVWVNTADMEQVFAHQRIQQKVIWYKNKIQIVTPNSYEDYVRMIEAQWEFGYQRAKLGLAQSLVQ